MPNRGSSVSVGGKVKVSMLKNGTGCLYPAATATVPNKQLTPVLVECEVTEVDMGMVTAEYFCEKCNRIYPTSFLVEDIKTE